MELENMHRKVKDGGMSQPEAKNEHLVCWFMRKTYENGSTQKCIDDNFTYKCPECYFVSSGKRVDCNQEINAKKIFNHMQRPEMYFYIAEAFEILDEKKIVLLY